jgi:rhamnosyltransferase
MGPAGERHRLSFGVCAATMVHDLGEEPIVVLGRALPSHSATRHYYHFRNAAWLNRYGDVPRGWKFVDAYRLLLRFGFYALFARPRLAHISAMLRGLHDGFRGRLGPAR